MNDVFGEPLTVGNVVAFSCFKGSTLGIGRIVKLCKKQVRIKITHGWNKGTEVLREQSYVVKYLGNLTEEE